MCTGSCDLIRIFSEAHTVWVFFFLFWHSDSVKQYLLCPTFMIIFMDLVLHTPPSWLSMPSMVPFEVAAAEKREEEEEGKD